MTKGELAFLDQMTRKKLVDLADLQMRQETRGFPEHPTENIYLVYSQQKKWVSAGNMLLAAGWDTAARFLKR